MEPQARSALGTLLRCWSFGDRVPVLLYPRRPRRRATSRCVFVVLAGQRDIRELIAFPKTKAAADPMTGAPSPVDHRQLKELHIAVTDTE